MKCSQCEEEVYSHGMCQIEGCKNPATHEGWYEVRDFAGITTGLMQRRKVCEDHICMLGMKNK
ncbi:MAG: hypothetical protein WC998_06655 [Candidatus Paceibacterota bacterium]|jgi:hypothetical protein